MSLNPTLLKGLKLFHVNIRSLIRKVPQLETLYSKVDFLCCTETWLDNRIDNRLIDISGMVCWRNDRRDNITDYNIHIIGGGVCIYVAKLWSTFVSKLDYGTKISPDFEILILDINKPGHKKMIIVVVYKPPKGKITKCIEFLQQIIDKRENKSKEVWILGDFNIDYLKRDCPNVIAFNNFLKKAGLKQLIEQITRPNKKGGSCIDYIILNSNFVHDVGITDDYNRPSYSILYTKKRQGTSRKGKKNCKRLYEI